MSTKPIGDDLATLFARADLGGDEKLDLMEFSLVLDLLGLSWNKAHVQHRFEQADLNHDGFISFPELTQLLITQGWTGDGPVAKAG